jgi:hypothetical protein
MSKKYRGKTCVYCGVPDISETRDHVLAREFALIERRRDLPIVPACKTCNNAKSQLENYLTVVLPFGARHGDARKNLSMMVPKRLAGNRHLHAELAKGSAPDWIPTPSGRWQFASAIHVDTGRLETWLRYLTLGLMWHHWEIVAAGRVSIEIILPRYDVTSELAKLFTARAVRRVATTSIGGGALTYEGTLGDGVSINAAWRFSIYDGLELAGADPSVRGNVHYVLVTPIAPTDQKQKDREGQ